MRYGCSIRSAQEADYVIKRGFDYLEMNLCALAAMTDAAFDAFRQEIAGSALKIEVFNLLLPLDNSIKIVGEDVDRAIQRSYLAFAFKRAHLMGCDLMVFGSGRGRAVPPGFSESRAYEQLVEFMRVLMEYADAYGIRMVIEPICALEVDNPVRTIAEAIELAKAVRHPNLFAISDNYHMYHENETMADLIAAGDWIKHAHISGVTAERLYPSLEDGFDYQPYFDALKAIGYDQRLSLECFDPAIDEGLVSSQRLFAAHQ